MSEFILGMELIAVILTTSALVSMGFDARALEGGYESWIQDYPVEPINFGNTPFSGEKSLTGETT